MKIQYLSFGINKTGGYRHELFFSEQLKTMLSKSNSKVELKDIRLNKYFTNVFQHVYLFLWTFVKSNADVNVVTSKLGVSAILRNLISKRKVYVVIHNHDDNDGKSNTLKSYYNQLFRLFRNCKHNRFQLVVVSHYWEKYFHALGIKHVVYFPNFFNTKKYLSLKKEHKNPWINLGQYSSKNDIELNRIARELTRKGYYCYYCTNNSIESKPHNGSYEVIYFLNFQDYLEQVSLSCCTLALTTINEGWNRMAHESILLGTPVIGYNKGGLGDLLKESNSVIVKNADEAMTCILEHIFMLPDSKFINKYDINNAHLFTIDI